MYSEDRKQQIVLDAVTALLVSRFAERTGKPNDEVLSAMIGSQFYVDFTDLEQGWAMCDILGVADKFSEELGYPKLDSLS